MPKKTVFIRSTPLTNDKEEVHRCPKSTLQADAWFLLLQHDSFCAMVQLTKISIVQCELVHSVQTSMCT